MRRIRSSVVLLLLASTASVAAAESEGRVAVLVGRKWMNDGGWAPVETQTDLGMSLSVGKRGWPVAIAVDVLQSHGKKEYENLALGGEKSRYEGKTLELALGVRRYFGHKTVIPYFGGGCVGVRAYYEAWPAGSPAPSTSLDVDAVGLWLGGGIDFQLSRSWSLGVDSRWTEAVGSGRATGYFPARRPGSGGIVPTAGSFQNEDHPKLGGLHAGFSLGFNW